MTDRSHVLECLKDARKLLSDPSVIDLSYIDEVIAKAEGRSALVDVPAVESEPVAWRHRLLGTQDWHVSNNTERDMKSARDYDQAFPGKLELEPLFAHPPRSLSNEGSDLEALTRPIIGIENRTAREVFDIMADRVRLALSTRKGSSEGDGSSTSTNGGEHG